MSLTRSMGRRVLCRRGGLIQSPFSGSLLISTFYFACEILVFTPASGAETFPTDDCLFHRLHNPFFCTDRHDLPEYDLLEELGIQDIREYIQSSSARRS